MTQVAVPCSPPRAGFVLDRLPETTPLSAEAAAELYAASLKDAVRAVATSGADLLVNYLPEDQLPAKYHADEAPESELRELVESALAPIRDDPHVDEPRFEPQVGSTPDARVGNTVTHLLEEEGVDSAAVLSPTAPLVGRTVIDGAAMKLRSAAVVLGPALGGRAYYAGFTDPIDFEAAYTPPALETMTDRALDRGHDVDYLDTYPTVDTPTGLATTVSTVRARAVADRVVPGNTTEFVLENDLAVREDDRGRPKVVIQ